MGRRCRNLLAPGHFRSDRLNFAHDLRMRLWMKHLNPNNSANLSQRDLLDPDVAARFWRNPSSEALIETYDEDADQPALRTKQIPEAFDRRLKVPVISEQLRDQLITADDDWDVVIDPDGS